MASMTKSYLYKHTQNCCFQLHRLRLRHRHCRLFSAKPFGSFSSSSTDVQDQDDTTVLTSGISRPLSSILKDLNKKVPESLVKLHSQPPVHSSSSSVKYLPWHIVNRIMNLHAPEWSGEVRNITYSADGKTVSVVYRVTLYGTDAEIFRESTGSATVSEPGCGPVQKAEAMAFRRACARLGLGLHLYHEDID